MRTTQAEVLVQEKSSKNLLIIGIISIVMFFGGLTSAYIVSMGAKGWRNFDIPAIFWVSTIAILISSATMVLAVESIKQNKKNNAIGFLIATLGLGIAFTVLQFMGWSELVANNITFTGKTSSTSHSFFYGITFLHLLHLLSGILAVIYCIFALKKNKYSPTSYNGLTMCGIYWHFLDVLWIYLFLFLIFVK